MMNFSDPISCKQNYIEAWRRVNPSNEARSGDRIDERAK
jgi:hypothetical protein